MNSKILWALGISLVVIIALTALLFGLPAPKQNTEQTADTQTTADTSAAPVDSAKSVSTSGAGARTFEKGVYVTTVYFTSTGFQPSSVIINKGEEVRFVNKTGLTMRVGSQVESASSPYYSSFSDPKSEPKGGTYQVALTQPGLWAYYNMTGDPFKGTVFVR